MSRPARRRAVVFDLDGTLLDSMPLVLEAVAHAIEPFGPRPVREIFARLGGPPDRFMRSLLGEDRHLPEALARFERFHHANVHLIRPFPRTRDLLERLREAGLQQAIWTGRDRVSTELLLRQHQLEGHFATMVCGDDLSSHKPDSEGLREIVRRLGVNPAETLFLGDADVDVLGGADCSVDTLLIRHAREVRPEIAARSWRSVLSPDDAYDVVLRCIAGGA